MKSDVATRMRSLVKLTMPAGFLVLMAACGGDATPLPPSTLESTVVPTFAATSLPEITKEPAATTIPNLSGTVVPVDDSTLAPIDAIEAEIAATGRAFERALNTSDSDLLASLFLKSENTNIFSLSEPLQINGWPTVESSFNGLLGLPSGSTSLVTRQARVDLLSDDTALWTGHFILDVRPPEESRQTVEGRFTVVLRKVNGEWLRVHMHTSALPP